jgi:hypothetical protein
MAPGQELFGLSAKAVIPIPRAVPVPQAICAQNRRTTEQPPKREEARQLPGFLLPPREFGRYQPPMNWQPGYFWNATAS